MQPVARPCALAPHLPMGRNLPVVAADMAVMPGQRPVPRDRGQSGGIGRVSLVGVGMGVDTHLLMEEGAHRQGRIRDSRRDQLSARRRGRSAAPAGDGRDFGHRSGVLEPAFQRIRRARTDMHGQREIPQHLFGKVARPHKMLMHPRSSPAIPRPRPPAAKGPCCEGRGRSGGRIKAPGTSA